MMDPYKMVIAVTNQKGGCAKTTTAVNLATSLSKGDPEKGVLPARVLLVDLDPQGNVSTSFGIDKSGLKNTVHQVLMNDGGESLPLFEEFLLPPDELTEAMQRAFRFEYPSRKVPEELTVENLWLLPSNIQLSGAEIELASRIGREMRLREALSGIVNEFDYVVIDTPPSLGLLTINALAAANWTLIPMQAEYYALEGMSLLMNTVKLVQRRINPHLKVFGIVMTMVIKNSRLCQMVCDEVRHHFPQQVFNTIIPRHVVIAEAPASGAPVTILHKPSPRAKGSTQYWAFAAEVDDRVARLREKYGVRETSRLHLFPHREGQGQRLFI